MAGRHLTEADHDKALHDSLLIDADTVDGYDAADFALAGHTHAGGSVAWGDITGTLSNQTDLQIALDEKADVDHEHEDVVAISDGSSVKWEIRRNPSIA